MIDLSNIKTILQVAGISRLEIAFDDKEREVLAVYVFKGESGHKYITYQEIINSLMIGPPGPLTSPQVDGSFELRDLSEET